MLIRRTIRVQTHSAAHVTEERRAESARGRAEWQSGRAGSGDFAGFELIRGILCIASTRS